MTLGHLCPVTMSLIFCTQWQWVIFVPSDHGLFCTQWLWVIFVSSDYGLFWTQIMCYFYTQWPWIYLISDHGWFLIRLKQWLTYFWIRVLTHPIIMTWLSIDFLYLLTQDHKWCRGPKLKPFIVMKHFWHQQSISTEERKHFLIQI